MDCRIQPRKKENQPFLATGKDLAVDSIIAMDSGLKVAFEVVPPDPCLRQPKRQSSVVELLAAPFSESLIRFKPGAFAGRRALALPYVDVRVIEDRLDEVLGPRNWQDEYECLPGGSVTCKLKIRLDDEWITKMDVGSAAEHMDEGDRRKAAFSDALKRAAVKFGIGRYLYRVGGQWVEYDPHKRQFLVQPKLQSGPVVFPKP
jgi:hypothetical protein